ncbi:UDP-N-acetylmuramoyl-tripeptide--D-alanyl-D-alanine ligase [Patescibacteria group bacterium]|nr:UDP-N-acetylmuramoyl-tripeptide--D-alanyl-D-alanine ligase [Patescibacteria group bacterium]
MIFNLLLLPLWFIVTVFDGLAWVYLYQAKEYRFDRLRAHWHTQVGKKELLPTLWLIKLGLLLMHLSLKDYLPYWLTLLAILVVLTVELVRFCSLYRHKILNLPRWTVKTRLMSGLVFFSQLLIVGVGLVGKEQIWIAVLLATIFLPITVGLAVLLLKWPTLLAKKRTLNQARGRMAACKRTKVIGITGSFGKTSTKEFLVHFLKEKGKVFSTHERENTLIGIAQRINKGLDESTDYFVVEMGAYQPGEISRMCQLTPPQVAVMTVLARQHLGLFGSFDRLVMAKMELVDSLVGERLVVANGDDERLQEELEKRPVKKINYSLTAKKGHLWAENVVVKPTRVSFELVAGKQRQLFELPLLGAQNVPNLLAAVAVARSEGMSLAQLSKAAKTLQPLAGTMREVVWSGKPTVIDDSYNSNPEGVLAAIGYLGVYEKEKWLVLQPMIELGKASVFEHRRVLKEAVRVCERVIMTNQNYWPGLKSDFSATDWAKITVVQNRSEFEKLVNLEAKKELVILFEGKETHKYLNYLVGHEA